MSTVPFEERKVMAESKSWDFQRFWQTLDYFDSIPLGVVCKNCSVSGKIKKFS